jgi:hypothetical protein
VLKLIKEGFVGMRTGGWIDVCVSAYNILISSSHSPYYISPPHVSLLNSSSLLLFLLLPPLRLFVDLV